MAAAPVQSLEESFPLLEPGASPASPLGDAPAMATDVMTGTFEDPGMGVSDLLSGAATIGMPVAETALETGPSDLTQIEGIGSEIAEMLNAFGISTYSDLASRTPDQIREMLGPQFAMHDPTTWSDQAQLAASGDWEGLRAWQSQLSGGVEAAAAPVEMPQADDFTRIEGVGPKIAEVLVASGVRTYADLAVMNAEQISLLLGSEYAAHDPSTWPGQSQMAASGQWDDLLAWQGQLDGGRQVQPTEDLKLIEGIGPKIEEILNAAGITSYVHLAGVTAQQVADLLVAAGGQYSAHDPTTWPQQAQMAAEGRFEELRAWQEELNGGQ